MNIEFKNFKNIIVWGAGNLGHAIMGELKKNDIKIDEIWDKRYEELRDIDGIKVVPPFSDNYPKGDTLIIFCVSNVPSAPELHHTLEHKGWKNIVKGIELYENELCQVPMNEPLNAKMCTRNELCTLCNCQRLNKIVQWNQAKRKQISTSDLFSVDRIHFIVNNFCNLKCSHCNRYMNTYPNEKKKNLPLDTILYDIKRVMKSVDAVGVGIVFGGEPFLHPNIDDIVGELLQQDNLGAILVNSNGVMNLGGNGWKNLADERVRVAFSNYSPIFNETQRQRFYQNADTLRESSVFVQIQNTTPTWITFPTLDDKGISEEECKYKRSHCDFPYLFVYDHKVFPCTLAMTIYDLDIADYPNDYVNILDFKDNDNLHDAIKALVERPSFETCRHCAGGGESVNAAEQGFLQRYAIP